MLAAPDGGLGGAGDGTTWRATRQILPGQELVYDYNEAFEDEPECAIDLSRAPSSTHSF